ncbi:LLM class flavin-dependent oxidoreductase [Nocardia vaccinii]|uniref:LLM class flavin-dependent oxidoreductase n=1 Tax=Nocardia vaccinii TaxID=1822 RepID=UPI000834F32B|nr:LLM class flavin-dependent oxidoreductase [Nocardia vaccinii]
MVEWFVFLPQIRMGMPDIVERAQAAEAAGFDGMAFIDHLLAPGAEHQPLWEAMTVATWVAARTERLKLGHLVLCDAFRHPAVLAKQAVTLQEASGGRFELGLGAGSVPAELAGFDITRDKAAARRERLGHTLELLQQYWGFTENEPVQPPRPGTPIPIVVGGSSAPVLELVRRHAAWWNLPVSHLDRLDSLRTEVGSARVSVQQMVGFVGREGDAEQVRARSERRFGYLRDGLVVGDAAELVDHFAGLAQRGVERFYVWFADFAAPRTLAEFGETVIAELTATGP